MDFDEDLMKEFFFLPSGIEATSLVDSGDGGPVRNHFDSISKTPAAQAGNNISASDIITTGSNIPTSNNIPAWSNIPVNNIGNNIPAGNNTSTSATGFEPVYEVPANYPCSSISFSSNLAHSTARREILEPASRTSNRIIRRNTVSNFSQRNHPYSSTHHAANRTGQSGRYHQRSATEFPYWTGSSANSISQKYDNTGNNTIAPLRTPTTEANEEAWSSGSTFSIVDFKIRIKRQLSDKERDFLTLRPMAFKSWPAKLPTYPEPTLQQTQVLPCRQPARSPPPASG